MLTRRLICSFATSLLLVSFVAACGDDDSTASPDTTAESSTGSTAAAPGPTDASVVATTPSTAAPTVTTAAPAKLKILVTNDDGFAADGIDAVVEGLRALPDTEVVVVAPATNQSGTARKTTPGTLPVADVKTKSGYAAKSVTGFPADSVIYALDQGGIPASFGKPNLVVSGINSGQNIGPLSQLSGTVGAAVEAAAHGIPALAASQGLVDPGPDFPSGVKQVLDWVAAHRADIVAGKLPVKVWNLNIPTCATGSAVRGVKEVPLATDFAGRTAADVDCASTATDPKDDVDAFKTGFAAIAEVPVP